MSISLFYSIRHMKSTDTILGAFAVLGFVLLAFFAFANPTNESELDTTDLATEDEEVLVADGDTDSETELTDVDNEVELENTSDDPVDLLTNELAASNLVDDLDPASIRASVEEFLQGPNGEDMSNQVLGLNNTNPNDVSEEELTNVTEVEVEDAIAETEAEVELENDLDQETELVANSDDDEPGAISRFFGNLFGDDDNDVPANVGGNVEGEADVEVTDADSVEVVNDSETYTVTAGDNIWDVLITDYGYSTAEAGNAINRMRNDSSLAEDFGVTSGSVDLIYPGQVLNISVL